MGKTRKGNEKQPKKGKKKTKKTHITKDAFVFSKKLTVDKRGSSGVLAGKEGCKTSEHFFYGVSEAYINQSGSRQIVEGSSNADTAQLRFEKGKHILVKERNVSKLIRADGGHGTTASMNIKGTKNFRSEMEDSHVVVDGSSAGPGSIVANIICGEDGSATLNERNVFTQIK